MHDPSTVAFEIRYPWRKYRGPQTSEFTRDYREPFVTIWHEDPETDGSDDSCDWFNHKRKLGPLEKALREAMWDMETILDNEPHYPNSREHKAFQPLSKAVRVILSQPSRTHWWQVHPRWHAWHWSIQVHPYQQARRWLLTRCCRCGKGFRYGESPVTNQWHSPKPKFLRGEVGLYHSNCGDATCATPEQAA